MYPGSHAAVEGGRVPEPGGLKVVFDSTSTRVAPSRGAEAPRTRATRQRAEVAQGLTRAGDFVSAQTLRAAMLTAGSAVGLTTVYRALAALVESGQADTVRDPGGERRYRFRPGPEHRHYLMCRTCGQSEPVDTAVVEDWTEQLARRTGYAGVRHTLELDGICAPCQHDTR